MLPRGLEATYRNALVTSHRPYLLVEVLDGFQNVLATDLTYLTGFVNATLSSRVARKCQITFDESFYPYEPDGLLAPYGNMIRAWRGIEFADGTRYRWIVFVGRIQETQLNDNGTCTAYAADFAADVVENKFQTPQNSQTLGTVSTEVTRLIQDGFPQATFATYSIADIPVQPLTWQLERGQALDELATSVGAFWYPTAEGNFTLRTYPWTVPGNPVVTYSDGDGGSVIDSTTSRSREDVYNVLTVTGERLNGDAAVFATASDTNSESPTFVNGNFGQRSQLLRLQTPSSQGSAQAAANDNLRRTVALRDTWSWAMTVDAALELGDIVSLDVRGRPDMIQVVDSYTLPLDVGSLMTVRGRAQIVGLINVEQ